MKRHSSDRHIQRQLEHHQTPVDAEALWANIEAEVQPPKRSSRWLFLWFLFSIIGIAAVWHLLDTNNKTDDIELNAIIASSGENQAAVAPPLANINQQESLANNVTESLSTTNNTFTEQTKTKKLQSSSNTTTHREGRNIIANRAVEKTTSIHQFNNKPSLKESLVDDSNVEQKLSSLTLIEPNELKEAEQQKADKSVTNNNLESSIPMLASLDYELLESSIPKIAATKRTLAPAPPTISRNGYSPWSLTARIGIGSTLQDLSSGIDSLREYQSTRELSEKQLETFSFEFGLQWTSKQRWYLRSGLGYRQTTERSSYVNSSTEIVQDPNRIVRIVLSSNGDTLSIERGLVEGQRTTTYSKTTYNRYRFLEIPIIAGYNFGEGPFSFGVEAGIVPQLLFQIKGEIQGMDGNFTSLETVSETKLAWSLHSAFNINYALNEQWQIQLSPVFRYQFTNLHKADYPLQVSYHSLGAQLGIRYAW